ncbi:MAG: divergent polysaccharide deacetylase family protein [Peptococcaceae bacterium]|nr:divergent polysaccharide deacetylase family protein [Peptococcaceae bacterium]
MYKRPKLRLFMILLVCFVLAGIYNLFAAKEPASTLNDMQGKIVVIDPGHGGNDTGCTDNNKIWEKNITLAVARELAQLLEAEGAVVKLTRSGDYQLGRKWFSLKKNPDDLDERVAVALKNNADIFVSLHINCSPKRNRAGAVVFYNQDNKSGQCLARHIQRELNHIPEMVKRTSRARDYYILNRLKMPAVVVELGYISSAKDRQHLIEPAYQKKMARSICTGITNYCNDSHKVDLSVNTETPTYDSTVQVNNDTLPDLYFIPKTRTRLFMASEEMDSIDMANDTVKELARLALEQLVDGPRKTDELSPCIPDGITFKNLKVSGPLATVDLGMTNKESCLLGSEGEWVALSSIAYTLFELPEIREVQVMVNGKQRKTLAGHMDISKPISRDELPLTKVAGGIMEGKKPKVAIVIDDCGQSNPGGVKEMLSIDRPLTFAVMPNLENSRRQAVQAAERGYEVIVHLPMQPVRGKASWLGPGAITSEMTAEEIRREVRRNFAQVPYATGFNNHMGSLVTSRDDLIRPVLEVAREKGFFVLDSRTSDKSKIIPLAQSMGIAYTQRDIFLDDVKSVDHMKRQLDLLADKALANGSAIGIGHVGMGGEKMARAIKEMIPVMEAKGIEFVYLCELLH